MSVPELVPRNPTPVSDHSSPAHSPWKPPICPAPTGPRGRPCSDISCAQTRAVTHRGLLCPASFSQRGFRGSSLQQVSVSSFLWLSNILWRAYSTTSSPIPSAEHSGRFHPLSNLNSAAVSDHVQVLVWVLFSPMAGHGIAGPRGWKLNFYQSSTWFKTLGLKTS